MKNSKEMAIYRKLLFECEPIDKYSSNEKRYKDLISQCILSIYNNVDESSNNSDNIVNGCAYSLLIDGEAYRKANLNISRSEVEEAIRQDKRYLELVGFYNDLGYRVVLLQTESGDKVFFIHLQDSDYIEWLEKNKIDLEVLLF